MNKEPMRYNEPENVESVLELLATDEDIKLISGGASLVAMMNARLVEPSALVSLSRIPEIQKVEKRPEGGLRLGAGVIHRQVAEEDRLIGGNAILRQAAARVANPVIRNMGTLGGSVAHFDPAADYPAALVAADAEIELAGAGKRRALAAKDFFLDWFTTALEPQEMVTGVLLSEPPDGSVAVYDKLVKTEGDMGIATVAAIVAMDGSCCRHLAVAVGCCGPTPVRLPEEEAKLMGVNLVDSNVGALGEALAAACDPVDDVRASADYRRLVVPRMVKRAVAAAMGNGGAKS